MTLTMTGELRQLDGLLRAVKGTAPRAVRQALRGVLFGLKNDLQAEFAGGIGPATKALTRLEQREPTGRALRGIGPQISYGVEEASPDGAIVWGRVGFGGGVFRSRYDAGARERKLIALFAGGQHVVDRELQQKIAGKIRSRAVGRFRQRLVGLGVPPARTGRFVRRFRSALSLDLSGILPKVGSVLDWPERDWLRRAWRRAPAIRADFARRLEEALRALP